MRTRTDLALKSIARSGSVAWSDCDVDGILVGSCVTFELQQVASTLVPTNYIVHGERLVVHVSYA